MMHGAPPTINYLGQKFTRARGWEILSFTVSKRWSLAHTSFFLLAPDSLTYVTSAAAAKLLQLCPNPCDPIDGSPPGSPVPAILQARMLEWVAISFNAWKWKVKVKSLSCVRLSNPMDCSLPGSSVHGIFQARVLEWGAIAFSVSH